MARRAGVGTTMVWLAFWACDGGAPPAPVRFTAGPVFEPNPAGAGLVGYVTLETATPSTVRVLVDDGGRTWIHAADPPAKAHRIRILGLAPDTEHQLTVTAIAENGAVGTASLTATTDPLPDDFPPFDLTSDPARMEPGLTFASFQPYEAMIDADGTVRWLLRAEGTNSFTRTARNTFLAIRSRTRVVELDLDGTEIASWAARTAEDPGGSVAVDVEAFHHDLVEMPNGNVLALSIERRWVEDFPTSDSDPNAPPADTWVAADVVVEFQRDGTVVNAWPLLDRLDPRRVGYDVFHSDYWYNFYDRDTLDWSHANALWYDAARDEVVVSLRHQDAVIALDHATGDLRWIFAPEANWRPPWDALVLAPATPGASPAYHQHGAKITADGTLMLFDNGNYGASAFEPRSMTPSRGAEFVLDHDGGTWDLGFQFGEELDPVRVVPAHGDCDPLPRTGNVLVTFGNVFRSETSAEVFEVTRTDSPEIVFHLSLGAPRIVARAERLSDLFPGF